MQRTVIFSTRYKLIKLQKVFIRTVVKLLKNIADNSLQTDFRFDLA